MVGVGVVCRSLRAGARGRTGSLLCELGWTLRIVGIEPCGRHDCPPQLFGRDDTLGHRIRISVAANVSDETISSSYYRLEVLRLPRIVLQGHADLADRGVNSLFDVDENVFAPKGGCNLLAGHELAPVVDQKHQQLKRQPFEPHRRTIAVELKAAKIQLEFAKSHSFVGHTTTTIFPVSEFWSAPHLLSRVSGPSDQLISLQTGSMDVRRIQVQHAITLLDELPSTRR